ncbi:MAG: CvpA family protein, partial [Actinomycetota bacterium]
MIANVLDIALAAVLVGYALIGYRQGFVVSVMSLVGFLAGGALGMWLLPILLKRWDSLDNNGGLRTAVLIFWVFILASVGQAIAVLIGSRLRRGMRVKPARFIDSVLGGMATVIAASVLIWFMAGAVRGGAPEPLAQAIGGSRVIQTIDRFVPPQTARLFASFGSVLDREGFPRVF